MYVCLCHGVTDRQIRAAADRGACTLGALERELGVGAGCGSCIATAREVLDAHLGRESESQSLSLQPQASFGARVL
jgi:bacterioferritin-associated ferredoxin